MREHGHIDLLIRSGRRRICLLSSEVSAQVHSRGASGLRDEDVLFRTTQYGKGPQSECLYHPRRSRHSKATPFDFKEEAEVVPRNIETLNEDSEWFSLYKKQWLSAADLKSGDFKKVSHKLASRFDDFRVGRLAEMTKYIEGALSPK